MKWLGGDLRRCQKPSCIGQGCVAARKYLMKRQSSNTASVTNYPHKPILSDPSRDIWICGHSPGQVVPKHRALVIRRGQGACAAKLSQMVIGVISLQTSLHGRYILNTNHVSLNKESENLCIVTVSWSASEVGGSINRTSENNSFFEENNRLCVFCYYIVIFR